MKTKNNFDSEELEILDALNNNKLISSKTSIDEIKSAKLAVKNTIEKFEEIKIEILVKDLQILKTKALQSGISYQNLISAIIHKNIEKFNITISTD
jgi:predicted DNA binding CopG/RHH family protein